MNASDLRKALAGTMNADALEDHIQKAITNGTVDDDRVSADDLFEKASYLLAQSEALEDLEDNAPSLFEELGDDYAEDGTPIFKGGGSVEAIVQTLGDNTDRVVDFVMKGNTLIGRSQADTTRALGLLLKAQADQSASLEAKIARFEGRIEQIAKAMSLPVPPRAVTGSADPAPSPLDPPVVTDDATGLTALDACDHIVELQKAASAEGDHTRVYALTDAISRLQSGRSVDSVFKAFNIQIPTRA